MDNKQDHTRIHKAGHLCLAFVALVQVAASNLPANPPPSGGTGLASGSGTVVAAIITAVGSIAVAIIAGIFGILAKRSEARLKESESNLRGQVSQLSKSFDDQLFERYGFMARRSWAEVTILNLDGDTRLMKGSDGVIVNTNFTLNCIPAHVQFGTPGCKITSGPTLSAFDFARPLVLRPRLLGDRRALFQVDITGGLTATDDKLSYAWEIALEKAFLISAEEVEKAYRDDSFKHEFYSFEVENPIGELEISVTFPNGYKFKPFAGVFIGKSEFLHATEGDRVRSGLEVHGTKAILRVSRPVVGFMYAIFWTSPSQAEVDRLRALG